MRFRRPSTISQLTFPSPLIAGRRSLIQSRRRLTRVYADAHHGVIAARAILTPINTRLKSSEVAYILEHSAASLILVDFEYTHLVPKDVKVPVIISKDTGRDGDPYEAFLAEGRQFSRERSWGGLDAEPDENAGATLCYT